MTIDRRTILCADVVALSVFRSWVVNGEEHFKNFAEGREFGIEPDLDYFGMSGIASANLFVRGVGDMPAHIAGHDGINPVHFPVNGFETPEAAAGKCCGFYCHIPLDVRT